MFETAPSFMAVLRGPGHVIELANPEYLKLIGRGGDIIGRRIRDVLTEVKDPALFRQLNNVLRTGEPFSANGAKVGLRAASDGSIQQRYVDFVFQPMRDATGAVTGVFVEGHDVTEQIENKQRLELSEESLRLANDAAGIGKWDLDLVTDTLDWDARTKAMFGFAADADCSMADFYAGLHPDDAEATTAAFAGAIDPAQRQPYDVEYRTVGATDGLVRWIAAKGRGVFDERGRCVRAIGTAIDITERHVRDDALQRKRSALSRFGRHCACGHLADRRRRAADLHEPVGHRQIRSRER